MLYSESYENLKIKMKLKAELETYFGVTNQLTVVYNFNAETEVSECQNYNL